MQVWIGDNHSRYAVDSITLRAFHASDRLAARTDDRSVIGIDIATFQSTAAASIGSSQARQTGIGASIQQTRRQRRRPCRS